MVDEAQDLREAEWREALWKWRWLGFRRSTPGFKMALVLLVAAATWIALAYTRL